MSETQTKDLPATEQQGEFEVEAGAFLGEIVNPNRAGAALGAI